MMRNPGLRDMRIRRKMGFDEDQGGIMKLFLTEEDNWNGHLENTKGYIRNFLIGKPGSGVTVLGSGWLQDVSVEYLLANFKKVVFCDIRHPKDISSKYKTNLKVKAISI